jgi:hypothetical protein
VKKSSLSLTLLILLSWTVSSAQTGVPISDTIRCYGIRELQYIAATIRYANACDTLLANSKLETANREQKLAEKDIEISKLNSAGDVLEGIITVKDGDIKKLSDDNTKLERHKKWLKLGWLTSSGLFTGFILYLSIKE